MPSDQTWMYRRCLPDGAPDPKWHQMVLQFVEIAFSRRQTVYIREGKECISCPCNRCNNGFVADRDTVTLHVLQKGFCSGYEVWHQHGECRHGTCAPTSYDDSNRMREMLTNAAGPDFNWNEGGTADLPNAKVTAFFDMLEKSEEPLWTMEFNGQQKVSCKSHSILSAITQCLALKAEHNMSQRCFNGMLALMKSMLPEGEKLPENFYQAKKFVKELGMDYIKIGVCPNFCMIYHKDRNQMTQCDECGEPRYEEPTCTKKKKPIERKTLHYLPITARLQRMYMTKATAEYMRWHKEGFRDKQDILLHPADGEAWKHFDRTYPNFASELRNVRLGLSTDGFMPYSSSAAPYSCWPVLVFPYNLPPSLLMKDESMFLALVIPGPKHPGRDIDILLEPLIDELKTLWSTGAVTYDVLRGENFIMRAMLLWTVSDFPGYALLSGWGTHGGKVCPYCMGETKSFRLYHGGKATWFDCHRCFLPPDHPFRRDVQNFLKNKIENDPAPPRLTGHQLLEVVDGLDEIKWGKKAPLNQLAGYGQTHHWQKRSIFWDLPYWPDLLIRHNLDLMHLEKNVAEDIFYIVVNIASRTKDNKKARKDLADLCKRPALHLTPNGEKTMAPYALELEERRKVLKWLKEKVKFPDGYASNWGTCVNLTNCTVSGLKSHDFHIFMERLLPAAFRDFIPDSIWGPLCELSRFFREICAKELDPHRIDQLGQDVIVTLCKLEKIFPPSFFNSMQHLIVHVAYEAKVGGPVNCRWMYGVERYRFKSNYTFSRF